MNIHYFMLLHFGIIYYSTIVKHFSIILKINNQVGKVLFCFVFFIQVVCALSLVRSEVSITQFFFFHENSRFGTILLK